MGAHVFTAAVLDRLLHHAHIINIRVDSYNLKGSMKAGLCGKPHN
nr:ATP-binding protein [Calorimonas adulescens]